jgi:hypothetical protein
LEIFAWRISHLPECVLQNFWYDFGGGFQSNAHELGVITEASENWTKDQICPYILHAIAVFGCDRIFYGMLLSFIYLFDAFLFLPSFFLHNF